MLKLPLKQIFLYIMRNIFYYSLIEMNVYFSNLLTTEDYKVVNKLYKKYKNIKRLADIRKIGNKTRYCSIILKLNNNREIKKKNTIENL